MPVDKREHMMGGAIAALFGMMVCIIASVEVISRFDLSTVSIGGLWAAIIVGLLKEFYDWASGKGTPEIMDFAATAGGGFIALVGVYIANDFIVWALSGTMP